MPAAGQDSHFLDVVRNGSLVFVLKGAGWLLSCAFNLLVARLVAADAAGAYFLALACVSVASTLALMGLDWALLRHVAVGAAAADSEAIRRAYRGTLSTAIPAALFLTAALLLAAPWVAVGIFSKATLVGPLRLMGLSLMPMTLVALHVAFFKGLDRPHEATFLETVGMPVIAIPLLLLLYRPLGVSGACLAFLASNLLLLALSFWLWRRLDIPRQPAVGNTFAVGLLRSSMPFYGIAILDLVATSTPTFLLGAWSTAAAVGIYGVAERLARLVSSLLSVANTMLPAKFVDLYERRQVGPLRTLAWRTALLTALLSAPVLVPLLVFPRTILGFFGPGFPEGSTALSVLAVAQFFNSAVGSVGYLLIVMRRERLIQRAVLASWLFQVSFSLYLIPHFGLIGAALGSAMYIGIANGLCAMEVKRHLACLTVPKAESSWLFISR